VIGGVTHNITPGSGDSYPHAIYFVQIEPSGELSRWVKRTLADEDSFTDLRWASTVVGEGGQVYVIGASIDSPASAVAHYSIISSTGEIGIWKETEPPFLASRYYFDTLEYQGRIYVLGGWSASEIFDATYYASYAPASENGGIQQWATTTPLPTPHFQHSVVEYEGIVYLTGGKDPENNCINGIYSSTIQSSGGLSSWQRVSVLPMQTNGCLFDHDSVISGRRLYLIGGMARDESGNRVLNDKVYYAPINSDGTLGYWEAVSSPETRRRYHAAVTDAKDRIYVIGGGQSTDCYQNYVYYTPLISFSKSADPPGEAKCADLITYTIHYAANMPGIILTNVVITDLVPSNVMLDRSSISDGGYERDGVIIWDNLEDFGIESGEHTVSFRVKVSETECGYDDPPTPTPIETSKPMAIPTIAYASMCPTATPTCTCTDPIIITNRAWINSEQESREATSVNSPFGIYLPIILKSGN